MWDYNDDIDHKIVEELSAFVADYIVKQILLRYGTD